MILSTIKSMLPGRKDPDLLGRFQRELLGQPARRTHIGWKHQAYDEGQIATWRPLLRHCEYLCLLRDYKHKHTWRIMISN